MLEESICWVPDISSKDKRSKAHFIEKSQHQNDKTKKTSKYLIRHYIKRLKCRIIITTKYRITTFQVRQIITFTNILCSNQLLVNTFFGFEGLQRYFGIIGVRLKTFLSIFVWLLLFFMTNNRIYQYSL